MSGSRQAIWIFLLWLLSFASAYATTPSCSAVFPDGASNNSNSGKIKFEWAAKIIGSPDNLLATTEIDDDSGGNSCGSVSCGKTGTIAATLDYNTFPNNSNDVKVEYNQTRTLYPGNYEDIKLESRASVTLTPGDYRIKGSLELSDNAQLTLSGDGVVRLLVKDDVKFKSGADVNAGGDAAKLIIYSRDDVTLESNATVTGFVYAKDDLKLSSGAEISGAISGKDIELKSSSSRVTYLPSAASSAAFGDLCGGGSVTPPSPPPAATGCAAIWPDAVQSHSNSGKVKFEWAAKAIDSPDNIIDAVQIEDNSGGVSCVNTTCTASFNASPELDFNGFVGSGGSDFNVEYKQSRTISPGTYKDIKLKGQATLTMEAGDYYITDDLKMEWDSDIRLPSSGVVRLFIDDKFESDGRGTINSNGNPEQLLIVARGDVKFKNTDDVKAFVYSQKKVEVGHDSDVVGAVSAKEVKLQSSGSTVTYDASGVASAAFGDVCSAGAAAPSDPIAEYRFDECTVEATFKDETGNYNATPRNVSTADGGVVGKALDLSASGTSDWVELPRSVANGLDDFSIALWIKTSVSKSQQEIMQALGSNTSDDELEVYLINSSRVRFQVRDEDVNLDSSTSLTDGNWHHLVLTRQGSRGCLYVDGSLQECENGLHSGTLSVPQNAFVIGQEQDSYGGSFSSSQAFEGLMDEIKIYNRTLSAGEASTIHTNELAGNNDDGSTRTPLDCATGGMVCKTYRDNFSSASFGNNEGSLNWLANWNEFDRGGSGVNSGDIEITGSGKLRITGRDNYINNNWIERRFSGTDYETATLSFSYDPSSELEDVDKMIVEVSTNGGSSYTQLDILQGLSNGALRSYSRDITSYMTADTRVRLRVYPDDGSSGCCFGSSSEYIDFDQFEVKVCRNEGLAPIADLRFDETSWSGTSEEIKDASGNGNHGSIVDIVGGSNSSGNVTNISDGKICRAGHVADNSSSSDIFAIDSGVDLNSLGDQHTVSFWYRPTDAWNDGLTRNLMDASGTTGSKIYYYLSKESDSKVEFGLENTSDSDYKQKSSSTFEFAAGTWVHIAATMDNASNSMKAYVNGVKVLERSTSGTLGDIFSLYLGDNRSSYTSGSGTGRSANGDFDELLVFNQALSDAQIASIYNNQNNDKNWDGSDRECAAGSTVDHYGISVTTPALTCEAATVTITAYDDSGNVVAPDSGTTITLSTDQTVDGWSLKTGNGSLSGSNYTFNGTDTSVVLNLMNTNPETIDIDVTDGSASAPDDNSNKDQSITFVDAAFRFSTIAAQTSGKNGATVTLSAIQTDADTGRCVALQPNPAANVDVTFAYSCENPGSCARAQDALTVAGVAVDSTAQGYTTVPVSFSNSGQATFNLNYNDAGQIKVHAQAELAVTGVSSKATVAGSSNAFVVSPAGLCVEAVDANAACATEDSSCSAFVAAGASFAMKVSGRQWQSNGDTNYCDNGTTPNFQLVDIPLTHSVVAPSGGETGDLGAQVVAITSNGEATISSQSISEVGVFTVTAQPPAYLGADTIPDSTSAAIGRFYPDRFVLSGAVVTDRSDLSCGATPGFTYMAENFQTSFNLSAQNANGVQTKNYTAGFAKLDQQSELNLLLVDNPSGGSLTDLSSRQQVNSATFNWPVVGDSGAGQGAVNVELALARTTSQDGPYAALTVAIAPDDGDAQLLGSSLDIDASGDGNNDHAAAGDTELRFGRMKIQNTYGPETASLNQPVYIQYFDGTNFVTNEDDSCTPFVTNNMTLQVEGESALAQGVVTNVGIGSGTTDLAIGTALTAGEANLTYSSPGAGNIGTVTNTYTVPAWLQFDWDGDDNPSATAIFGRYRGNDRVIYWLEQ